MELLISLEDEKAVDSEKSERYRDDLVHFLLNDSEVRREIGEEYTVCESFGYTYGSNEPRDNRKSVTIAKGAGFFREIGIDESLIRQIQPPLKFKFFSRSRENIRTVPVLVIDSDGVNPDRLLDYIGNILGGGECNQDSIYMGGIKKWIWVIL